MFERFLFLFSCELGEMMTNHFEKFKNALDQSDWTLFPIKIQKLFIIVLFNAQQPTIVHGYGNTPCIRETFKKVHLWLSILR